VAAFSIVNTSENSFLLYKNNAAKIVLYADDILLYWPVSSDSDFVSLQSDTIWAAPTL